MVNGPQGPVYLTIWHLYELAAPRLEESDASNSSETILYFDRPSIDNELEAYHLSMLRARHI